MRRSCEENENSWTDTNSNSDNDSTGPGKLVNSSSLKILTGPQGVIKICTSGESVCSREIRSVPLAQNKKVTVISSTPPVHKLSSRNSPTYCACESKTHRKKGLRSSSISVQTYSLARKRFPDESLLGPIQSPVNSCSTIATYGSMQSCSTPTETTQTRVSFANKKPIDNKSSRYSLYNDCDNNRMVPSLPAAVPENTAKTIHISLTNDGPSSYSAYAQQEGAFHVSSQTTAAKPKYTENRVQRICRKLNFCKGPSVRSRTHKCGSQTDRSSVIKVSSKHKQYPLRSSGADLQTNHPSSTIVISTPTKPKHLLLQLTQSRSICSLPYHPPIANHSSSTHI